VCAQALASGAITSHSCLALFVGTLTSYSVFPSFGTGAVMNAEFGLPPEMSFWSIHCLNSMDLAQVEGLGARLITILVTRRAPVSIQTELKQSFYGGYARAATKIIQVGLNPVS
jgi:hypothetical protein